MKLVQRKRQEREARRDFIDELEILKTKRLRSYGGGSGTLALQNMSAFFAGLEAGFFRAYAQPPPPPPSYRERHLKIELAYYRSRKARLIRPLTILRSRDTRVIAPNV